MDDQHLVAGMLAGDEEAFTFFSEAVIPALYRFAFFRLDRDRELTRDIVQDTVVKAISKLSSFRGEAAFTTWLCACCRTEIAMHFRKRGRRPREVELDERVISGAAEVVTPARQQPEGALLRREKALAVHMALDLVSDRYRQVLAWKYFDELPVKEIAARLRVGPKAAESLLTRARRSFRQRYDELLNSDLAAEATEP